MVHSQKYLEVEAHNLWVFEDIDAKSSTPLTGKPQ